MIISKEQITEEILQRIKDGAVFICPTDTIYGLSCDATNQKAVERIRKLKNRPDSPLSIWAPSKEWISQNCFIEQKWVDKLPGPYTFIAPMATNILAKNVNPKNKTVGVRLPKHWFSEIVEKLNIPLITTSANKAGESHMVSLKTLNQGIKKKVDFIIYEGEKENSPSTLVDTEKDRIIKRK